MFLSLPERPDLKQLRRQAKELRDAVQRGDPAALERFVRQYLPTPQGAASLAAAQLVVAREPGFSSWPKLKAAVDDAVGKAATSNEFVAASVYGRLRAARAILVAKPAIAR
ncbi:MAG: hypothetical protein JOZ65_08645, partial [Chloroflexi bacterium]|nr:hypothetical protein [Chloroflexota bacterium]